MSNTPEGECCPQFNPTPWNEKKFTWKDKKFIKASVFSLFYMPINFGQVITSQMKKVEKTGGVIVDNMGLADHTSKWNMDLYLAVDKIIPDANNITLSGSFVSKVYDGDFKETGKWMEDYDAYIKEKNLKVKKIYMWYTTCPKCAKKYGRNYVVVVGQVEALI
jgi:hypothetical protein